MKLLKYISVVFLSGFIAFGAASCTNLEEEVFSSITEDNLDLNDESVLESLSASVYSNLRFMYWGYYGLMDLVEESSDLYVMPARVGIGWGDYYISYHKHMVNSENANMNGTNWGYGYTCITNANSFCQIMEAKGVENLSESARLAYARVRCIRALVYYVLFDNYRWIPLVKGAEEENVPGYLPMQENPDVTFDWIVSELEDIKDELGTAVIYGQPNRYTAEMILAKMYLNHNAWFKNIITADELREGKKDGDSYASRISDDWYKKAERELQDIIDSKAYQLEPNFKDNFKANLAGCKEAIFVIPLDVAYASHNYTAMESLFGEGGKAYGLSGAPWNGGAGIPQFINTYHPNDTRFDDTWAHDQQYEYTEEGGAQSGDALMTTSSDLEGEVPLFYTKQIHSVDNPGCYMLEGYRNAKLEICPGRDATWGDDVNFFRLADAYLMAAECALRLGGKGTYTEDDAVRFVNLVRERNFKGRNTKTFKVPADPDAAVRTLADLKGGSCYKYGIDEYYNQGIYETDENGIALDGAKRLTAYEFKEECHRTTNEGGDDIIFGGLLDELAWEFVFEHHRRQDLIRFEMTNGQNVWNGKSWFCKERTEDVNDTHYNVFPIYIDYARGNKNLVQPPYHN